MPTQLTETGWEDANGNPLGIWTNQADTVDTGDGIRVALDVTANTLSGDDTIFESFDINAGIINRGTIKTENGRDTISGGGRSFGIINQGIIETGNDHDTISGRFGNIASIDNSGTIRTGAGNDEITGSEGFGTGIVNTGMIETGSGCDIISGSSIFSAGIDNSGMIETGKDRDTVDALSGGFSGGGTINLDNGDDLIRGFGTQIVDGGCGFDAAELGIEFDQTLLSLGSSPDTDIEIGVMFFTNVEVFDFNGQEFTLEDLQGFV